MVMLGVNGESGLYKAAIAAEQADIRFTMFFESDPVLEGGEPMGHTSICTEPVRGDQRRAFKKFQNWKANESVFCEPC